MTQKLLPSLLYNNNNNNINKAKALAEGVFYGTVRHSFGLIEKAWIYSTEDASFESSVIALRHFSKIDKP